MEKEQPKKIRENFKQIAKSEICDNFYQKRKKTFAQKKTEKVN